MKVDRWTFTARPDGLLLKGTIPGGAAVTVVGMPAQAAEQIAAMPAEIERLKEALRRVYGFAAAIQRMTSFAPTGFRCSLIREVVSRALPDDEAKRLHDETEVILDTLTEERPGESQP